MYLLNQNILAHPWHLHFYVHVPAQRKYSCAHLIPPFLRIYLTIIFFLNLDYSISTYLLDHNILAHPLTPPVSTYQLDRNILAHWWHLSFLRNTKYVSTQILERTSTSVRTLTIDQSMSPLTATLQDAPCLHLSNQSLLRHPCSSWSQVDSMKIVSVPVMERLECSRFVEYIPAQWASRNRPRGAIVTTPFSVTKNKYREFMVMKVIPAINDNWPARNCNIIIATRRSTSS